MNDQGEDDGVRDFGAAFVIHVAFADDDRRRSPEARLEEAIGLAEAIDLKVVFAEVALVSNPRPATLIGSGETNTPISEL